MLAPACAPSTPSTTVGHSERRRKTLVGSSGHGASGRHEPRFPLPRPCPFTAHRHSDAPCSERRPRSHWRDGTLPKGIADGWSWTGKDSARFYAYPNHRWLPPPLHRTYVALPLPRLDSPLDGGAGGAGSVVRRVYVANKRYPEGSGKVENSFDVATVAAMLDALLACGTQVVYNHPNSEELASVATPDANDRGRAAQNDDVAMVRRRYARQIASGAVVLLPSLAPSAGPLSFNEVQLRAVARAGCFVVPQGGAGLLTFYQPGLHVVHDVTGKERCRGDTGEYFQYWSQLPQTAGESIVLNTNGDAGRLRSALRAMCETSVCEREPTRAWQDLQ